MHSGSDTNKKEDSSTHKSESSTQTFTTCALIPAYNEELVLPSVILRAREFVDRVIVVDDGSTDRTAKVAELAGATVYRMPENRGKAAAVMEGFSRIAASFGSASLSGSGSNLGSGPSSEFACDAVILLDADGQHEPEQIPDLLEPILDDEADLVIGSRFLTKDSSIPAFILENRISLISYPNSYSILSDGVQT